MSLLTSQLLSTPAIWNPPQNLQTAVRILALFNSASVRLLSTTVNANQPPPRQSQWGPNLGIEEWTTAVVKGADERSPRARHALVLGGLLLGFEGHDRRGLPAALRRKLESAAVKTINLTLQDARQRGVATDQAIVVALCQVFDLLDPAERMGLDCDLLLPTLVWAPFFSIEGLHRGYFLSTIDRDVVEGAGKKFDWSTKSTTYAQLQTIALSPIIESLGPLSRIAAISIENARDTNTLAGTLQDLFEFSRSLCLQWRQNKLCEIDPTEEVTYLTEETLRTPVPLLWRVLRSTMFAIVIMLRSYLGRVLSDQRLGMKGLSASLTSYSHN